MQNFHPLVSVRPRKSTCGKLIDLAFLDVRAEANTVKRVERKEATKGLNVKVRVLHIM